MGLLARFFERQARSDAARHAAEIRAWSETVPGTTRIADANLRERVKVAGIVRRITVHPSEGKESLDILLTDGDGECEVVLMGRRGVAGMSLGTRVVVEGMLGERHGVPTMVNPQIDLAAG
jgi:cytochrome c-type biogenesis protein CcmE